jgi:hypothetical protein
MSTASGLAFATCPTRDGGAQCPRPARERCCKRPLLASGERRRRELAQHVWARVVSLVGKTRVVGHLSAVDWLRFASMSGQDQVHHKGRGPRVGGKSWREGRVGRAPRAAVHAKARWVAVLSLRGIGPPPRRTRPDEERGLCSFSTPSTSFAEVTSMDDHHSSFSPRTRTESWASSRPPTSGQTFKMESDNPPRQRQLVTAAFQLLLHLLPP